MYGYIYKTTNLLNNKFYIGQKKSDRFLAEDYLGSGRRLRAAIDKYGAESFFTELIDTAESKYELDQKELYWIDFLDARNPDIAYNIAKGGDGGDTGHSYKGMPGRIQSEAERQKRSESLKKAYREGRHLTILSDESRSIMSQKAKSRKKSKDFTTAGRKAINNGIINKLVFEHELEKYLQEGWIQGKIKSNKPAWNKGLTKNTDDRLKKVSDHRRQLFEINGSIGCFGVKGNNFQKHGKLKDLNSK